MQIQNQVTLEQLCNDFDKFSVQVLNKLQRKSNLKDNPSWSNKSKKEKTSPPLIVT